MMQCLDNSGYHGCKLAFNLLSERKSFGSFTLLLVNNLNKQMYKLERVLSIKT